MERTSPGQLLLIGIPGTELDLETAAVLKRLQPGGFIIFGRNIESAPQLRKLIDDLRDVSEVEPIITIDQEGGRVSRIRLIGNEPPSAQQLRKKGDLSLIKWHGSLTGRLLRLFGFNLDLCPVLDISFDDEADNSLKGRCYGTSVAETIHNAGIFNDALRGEGVASCGKHFPGYTMAGFDPHHDLPTINRTREELDEVELAVFKAFIDKVDSMMIGHAIYPHLDNSGVPTSLSPQIIDGLLKKDLGYRGLVMTDDLDMGAILNGHTLEDVMTRGVAAGNDMLMICHRLEAAAEAGEILRKLPAAKLDPALESLAGFKEKMAPLATFSEPKFWKLDKEVWDLRVATLGEEGAAKRSAEDGKRSPVETY